jgi:hypothetical protein
MSLRLLIDDARISGAQNGHTYTSVFANTLIALAVLQSVDPVHHGGDGYLSGYRLMGSMNEA